MDSVLGSYITAVCFPCGKNDCIWDSAAIEGEVIYQPIPGEVHGAVIKTRVEQRIASFSLSRVNSVMLLRVGAVVFSFFVAIG